MWTLEEWLTILDLEKYLRIFIDNEITNSQICCRLDDNSLIAIGVQNEKDRTLILQNLPIHEPSGDGSSNVSRSYIIYSLKLSIWNNLNKLFVLL